MGRPVGSKNKSKSTKKKKDTEEKTLKHCQKCQSDKAMKEFYRSSNQNHGDGRIPYCYDCIQPENENDLHQVMQKLLTIDKPFLTDLWESTKLGNSVAVKGQKIFGNYLRVLYLNHKTLTHKDSDINDDYIALQKVDNRKSVEQLHDKTQSIELSEDDLKSKSDCIRLLGYDPFTNESEPDKPRLYNNLVEYLDENTLEDGFKLNGVIQIVRAFNQIGRIDDEISRLSNDYEKNAATIKTLTETKEKQNKFVLSIAKDNGVSINHSHNKSKGAGTLSGIIKDLNEKGIEEAQINLYEIETAEGMRQVADISNKSIMSQLQFDENDYTQMLHEQREMIEKLRSENAALTEENRLLKIGLKQVGGNNV